MKIPAVAIAAAFACGIALGLCGSLANSVATHGFLSVGFSVAAFLIVIGVGLAALNKLATSANDRC
jgi:hypothetical protein